MNKKIIIDCYNHFDENEHISLIVNENENINQIEFCLKKKLKIKIDKKIKLFLHTELKNLPGVQEGISDQINNKERLKLYYLIFESPKYTRTCNIPLISCLVRPR